jgi:molybdenum cofactor cytidylyltransferase
MVANWLERVSFCHDEPQKAASTESPMSYPDLHVLVLAAGASTRLGQPKQLVKLGGSYALSRVVSTAVAIGGSAVTVVIGANSRELTHLLAHSPASVIVNRHWEEGIASSIRFGIAAVPSNVEAVLILLGDQVAVTPEDLRRLVSAWKGQEGVIATATYQQHAGVPAIFPRWSFTELDQLRGDVGARVVLQRNAFRLAHVPMPNAAVDLDTKEDLVALQARFGGEVNGEQ